MSMSWSRCVTDVELQCYNWNTSMTLCLHTVPRFRVGVGCYLFSGPGGLNLQCHWSTSLTTWQCVCTHGLALVLVVICFLDLTVGGCYLFSGPDGFARSLEYINVSVSAHTLVVICLLDLAQMWQSMSLIPCGQWIVLLLFCLWMWSVTEVVIRLDDS